MTHHLDFGSLTVKDALDLAIFIEEEARDRYDDFAAQMEAHRTPEAARFFRHMAENELKHATAIADRRTAAFGDAPVTADRSMLFDVEAPAFEQARAFMGVKAALEVALAAETKAYEFYDAALPTIKDPQMQELFGWLRDEEVKHQEMVRRLMDVVPEDGDFDPEDFVDAPTGQ